MTNKLESFNQFPLNENSAHPDLSVVEYGVFPGVSSKNYEQMMGHRPDILLPGVFSIKDVSENPHVFTCEYSKEARELSEIKGEEIMLVELVPKELVDLAIEKMAGAVETLIDNSNGLPIVVSPVLNGGLGPYKRIESLTTSLQGLSYQEVRVKRSYGDSLGEIKLKKDFEDVRGAHVIIFEDLGDEHLTLRYLSERAVNKGAAKVSIVMLMNKIGVPNKELLKDIEIVGFGIPNLWVGGAGPDFMSEIGRQSPNVSVMMRPREWAAYQYNLANPIKILGLMGE